MNCKTTKSRTAKNTRVLKTLQKHQRSNHNEDTYHLKVESRSKSSSRRLKDGFLNFGRNSMRSGGLGRASEACRACRALEDLRFVADLDFPVRIPEEIKGRRLRADFWPWAKIDEGWRLCEAPEACQELQVFRFVTDLDFSIHLYIYIYTIGKQ